MMLNFYGTSLSIIYSRESTPVYRGQPFGADSINEARKTGTILITEGSCVQDPSCKPSPSLRGRTKRNAIAAERQKPVFGVSIRRRIAAGREGDWKSRSIFIATIARRGKRDDSHNRFVRQRRPERSTLGQP